MPSPTARIHGYTQLLLAFKEAPKATRTAMRAGFRAVGQIVATDAAKRLDEYSEKTAAGLKPYVRLRGVEVDQTLPKTTGLRPDWGRLQMSRGLYPAVDENEEKIAAGIEAALVAANESVGLTP